MPVHLLDSTVVSLCLSAFDWAAFRTSKGAVKMHTLLDYDGKLPVYVNITEGKVGDSKGAFFVVRHYENLCFTLLVERDLPETRAQHVLKDEEIELTHAQSKAKYPGKLRRVAIWDDKNEQTIELITNNFKWSAQTIGDLYKSRWQIKVFYRDIKQLLHIKTFIGTSKNAVLIQTWSALITILLLKVLKATAKYGWHLSNLLAFIPLNIFVKIELQTWLDKPFQPQEKPPDFPIQGVLFPNYR